jgi:hypothetical protein
MYIREQEEMQLMGLWLHAVQVIEMLYEIVECIAVV